MPRDTPKKASSSSSGTLSRRQSRRSGSTHKDKDEGADAAAAAAASPAEAAEGTAEGKAEVSDGDAEDASDAGAAGAGAASGEGGEEETVDMSYVKKMIGQREFADVTLFPEGKGNELVAHEFVLAVRCPELLKGTLKKGRGAMKNIEHPEVDAVTLQRVLDFVYTDVFDFKKLKDDEVITLNRAATRLKLPRLNWLCASRLTSGFTLDNIYAALAKAEELGQNDLKDLAVGFFMRNFAAAVKNKEGVRVIGVDLFTELVQLKEIGEFEEKDVGPEPPRTLVADMRGIHDAVAKSKPDLTWKVGGGKSFKLHRAVVGNHSAPLFERANVVKSGDTVEIPRARKNAKTEMAPLSAAAASALLAWLYFGKADIAALSCCELIPFCKDYGLGALRTVCEKIILASIDETTALPTLEVAYLDHMKDHGDIAKDMIQKATAFTLENLPKIDLAAIKKMDPAISRDLLVAEQTRQKQAPAPASAAAASSASSTTLSVPSSPAQKKGSLRSGGRRSSSRNHSTVDDDDSTAAAAADDAAPAEKKDSKKKDSKKKDGSAEEPAAAAEETADAKADADAKKGGDDADADADAKKEDDGADAGGDDAADDADAKKDGDDDAAAPEGDDDDAKKPSSGDDDATAAEAAAADAAAAAAADGEPKASKSSKKSKSSKRLKKE